MSLSSRTYISHPLLCSLYKHYQINLIPLIIKMCLGNRALASINFLNQQYQALYGNAKSCTEHYGTGLRPQRSEVEYGTCLYEFYGPGKQAGRNPSKNDLSCWFSFAQAPKLEFVCNHEVILYFYTTDGSYILDVTKTSATKA